MAYTKILIICIEVISINHIVIFVNSLVSVQTGPKQPLHSNESVKKSTKWEYLLVVQELCDYHIRNFD